MDEKASGTKPNLVDPGEISGGATDQSLLALDNAHSTQGQPTSTSTSSLSLRPTTSRDVGNEPSLRARPSSLQNGTVIPTEAPRASQLEPMRAEGSNKHIPTTSSDHLNNVVQGSAPLTKGSRPKEEGMPMERSSLGQQDPALGLQRGLASNSSTVNRNEGAGPNSQALALPGIPSAGPRSIGTGPQPSPTHQTPLTLTAISDGEEGENRPNDEGYVSANLFGQRSPIHEDSIDPVFDGPDSSVTPNWLGQGPVVGYSGRGGKAPGPSGFGGHSDQRVESETGFGWPRNERRLGQNQPNSVGFGKRGLHHGFDNRPSFGGTRNERRYEDYQLMLDDANRNTFGSQNSSSSTLAHNKSSSSTTSFRGGLNQSFGAFNPPRTQRRFGEHLSTLEGFDRNLNHGFDSRSSSSSTLVPNQSLGSTTSFRGGLNQRFGAFNPPRAQRRFFEHISALEGFNTNINDDFDSRTSSSTTLVPAGSQRSVATLRDRNDLHVRFDDDDVPRRQERLTQATSYRGKIGQRSLGQGDSRQGQQTSRDRHDEVNAITAHCCAMVCSLVVSEPESRSTASTSSNSSTRSTPARSLTGTRPNSSTSNLNPLPLRGGFSGGSGSRTQDRVEDHTQSLNDMRSIHTSNISTMSIVSSVRGGSVGGRRSAGYERAASRREYGSERGGSRRRHDPTFPTRFGGTRPNRQRSDSVASTVFSSENGSIFNTPFDTEEEGIHLSRSQPRNPQRCQSCLNPFHRTFQCTMIKCFKCRQVIHDWTIQAEMHPLYCQDGFKGFMRPRFEINKTIFYSDRKYMEYQNLSPTQMRTYYNMLNSLTPGNEFKFGKLLDEMLPQLGDFGNMGARSLIVAYDLLWRSLLVRESFEIELHDVQIRHSESTIRNGNQTIRPYELTFTIKDGNGESRMVREEQAFLRRKLKYNGIYGFPIFICLRENGQALVDQETDTEWPDHLPRKKISPLRKNTTVYSCSPPGDRNECTLLIDQLKVLRHYVRQRHVPQGTIYLAFNHHSKAIGEKIREMKQFMDSPSLSETFPRTLYTMLENFYDPIVGNPRFYCDVRKRDLEQFNQLLPQPYQLSSEQLRHAIVAYEHEMSAIIGPSGTGKTTILCFLAIYNFFMLGKRTLLLATRRAAANDITLRLVRMSRHLLDLPEFRNLANGHQYIWYKMEKDSLMEPRDPEIEAVSSFDHHVPEQVTMLVGILNFLTSDVVIQFKSDHVLLDEASSVSTLNFCELLIMLNQRSRHVPQTLTFFGDPFQLSSRFSKEPFLSDRAEANAGFDEGALIELLKRKLPHTQMTHVVRLPRALCKIIQPFYDFDLFTSQSPSERPVKISFADCCAIRDLRFLQDQQIVSLFINLPSKDTNGNHFCDADDQMDRMRNRNRRGGLNYDGRGEESQRKLAYSNKRNVFYAVNVLGSVLKNNRDLSAKDCMYLTPYRIQESEFYHRKARPTRTLDVRGHTIDRAISNSAEFVLIDLTRTSPEGFMNGQPEEWPAYPTAQRLLVSLSRATRAQVIIGSVDRERIRTRASNPIDKLAAHHLNSRDPMVAFIDIPSSAHSRDYFYGLV